MMTGDDAIFALRSPVKLELVKGVGRIFFWMLFPGRITVIDSVGNVKIFLFNGMEEVVD